MGGWVRCSVYGLTRVVCVPSLQLRPLQHQYEKYLQLFEPVGPELSLAFTNTAFANFIQSAMESSTVQQTIHNFVLLPREVLTWGIALTPHTWHTDVHHAVLYPNPALQYIPRLLTQLLLISSLTPTSHEDQKPLTHVIEGTAQRTSVHIATALAQDTSSRPLSLPPSHTVGETVGRQWGNSGRDGGRDSGETVGETVGESPGRQWARQWGTVGDCSQLAVVLMGCMTHKPH